MVTLLESDILECKVKWALGSITTNKVSGGDGIPAELSQILKDAVKVLHSICQQIWKTLSTGLEKVPFSFQSQRKAMPKSVQTTIKLCSFHMSARSCSKSFKPGSSTVCELKTARYSSWFRKGRRTNDQMANIHWIIEKAREFQKNIYFCFMDYSKAFDCVDHNKVWKILQEMGIPDH